MDIERLRKRGPQASQNKPLKFLNMATSYHHARDYQTDAKYKEDFIRGIKYQALIQKRLGYFFPIRELKQESFLIDGIKTYSPDCEVFLKNVWQKIEIKYSQKDMPYFDWKTNQWEAAKEQNIKAFFVTKTKFALISPWAKGELITKGYCNKPVWRIKTIDWLPSLTSLNL